MKKYDNYKDSGIEWIGEIPEHWENIQIKHLAIGDNTLFLDGDWIESKEIIYDNGEYRYITTGNVGEGKYKEQGNTYITQETFEKLNCTEVVPDDLLISRLNPPIGRSCLVPDLGNKIITSVDNVILRPSPKYKKNYLVHFFTNTNYFEYTSLVGRGATMQRISRSMLGDIKIALPPTPEEQTAIANYLDRKTIEIDELIADKKRLLELYEEEKTAIINQAVTKGINSDVPMKDSGIEWLGEIPEHWEIANFNHYVFLRHGYQFRNFDFTSNGIKIIKISQLLASGKFETEKVSFIDENRLENFKDILIKEGDILMALTGGTIGKIIRVPTVNEPLLQNYRVGNFFPINEQLSKDFLFWILSSDSILAQIFYDQRETGQPNIGKEDFGKMKIVFPKTMEEQTEIVKYIETEISRVNFKKENTNKLIDLLTEYRTALISEVVTGKIKVI